MAYTKYKLLLNISWLLLNLLYLVVVLYLNQYIQGLPSLIEISILMGEIFIEAAWFGVSIVISGAYDMFMVSYGYN